MRNLSPELDLAICFTIVAGEVSGQGWVVGIAATVGAIYYFGKVFFPAKN